MELHEFFVKFLHDYKEKHNEFLKEGRLLCLAHQTNYDEDETAKAIVEHFFNCSHFESALANYTALICKRQRYNCHDHFCYNEDGYAFETHAIIYAPQPYPDEL